MLRVILSVFVGVFMGWALLASVLQAKDNPSPQQLEEAEMSETQNHIDALLDSEKKQIETVQSLLEKQKHEGMDENEKEKNTAKEAARCSAQQFFSKQQDQVKWETDRVYRTFHGDRQEQSQPGQNAEQLGPDEAIYVFISSSMPESTIRTYFSQITATKESRVSPVMFGLTKGLGSKSESGQYLSRILLVDAQCQDAPGALCERFPLEIRINPVLFKKYSITSVPSVVYVKGNDWWSVQGDSTLDYMLGKINQEANSPAIDSLITKIRN